MRPASIRAQLLAATLLIAGFALSVTARAQQTQQPTKTTQPKLAQGQPIILPGQAPDLLMFYTGEVVGYLSPCG